MKSIRTTTSSSSHRIPVVDTQKAVPQHLDTHRRALELGARLESLLRRLHVGVFRCTVDGHLLEANAPMLVLLGGDLADTSSSAHLAQLFDSTKDCLMLLQGAAERYQPQEREIEVRQNSGDVSYFRLSVVPTKTSDGEMVIDGLATDITARKYSEDGGNPVAAAARKTLLTSRQRQVLDAVVAGKANKVIAHELQITEKTVEKHRANLMRKLQVKSVAELVRLALEPTDVSCG